MAAVAIMVWMVLASGAAATQFDGLPRPTGCAAAPTHDYGSVPRVTDNGAPTSCSWYGFADLNYYPKDTTACLADTWSALSNATANPPSKLSAYVYYNLQSWYDPQHNETVCYIGCFDITTSGAPPPSTGTAPPPSTTGTPPPSTGAAPPPSTTGTPPPSATPAPPPATPPPAGATPPPTATPPAGTPPPSAATPPPVPAGVPPPPATPFNPPPPPPSPIAPPPQTGPSPTLPPSPSAASTPLTPPPPANSTVFGRPGAGSTIRPSGLLSVLLAGALVFVLHLAAH